jgi:hypothetical protein
LHALARRARARGVPCAVAERTAALPDFTRALASAYPSLDLSGQTQRQARSRLLAAVERRPPLVLLDHLFVRGVARLCPKRSPMGRLLRHVQGFGGSRVDLR